MNQHYRNKELCLDNKVRDVIGDVYCHTRRIEKCVYISTEKRLVSTTVKGAKPAATFWIFLVRTKNRHICCLAVTVPIFFQERRVATTKKKNHLHVWRNCSANHKQVHPNLNQEKLKWVQRWNKSIRFLLADDFSDIFTFQIILYNFNQQSTAQI